MPIFPLNRNYSHKMDLLCNLLENLLCFFKALHVITDKRQYVALYLKKFSNHHLGIWIISFLLILFNVVSFASEPLPPEQAFPLSAIITTPNTLSLRWQTAPGNYLYREKIVINTITKNRLQLGSFTLPQGESKVDNILGTYQIYRHPLSLDLPILGLEQGKAILQVNYQGCTDLGFCYPPATKQFIISFDSTLTAQHVKMISSDAVIISSDSNTSRITHLMATQHLWLTLVTFFGLGLLLAFTPCVLPMLPILSSIILGQQVKLSTQKATALALTYVLSMSVTYALLGISVATLGNYYQGSFQTPWLLAILALGFVALAFAMFGYYELKLPSRLQLFLTRWSNQQESGSFIGAAMMGITATILLSPCVTAPLIGILAYISQTGNLYLGASALFILSLGMGTPLLLLTTSANQFLPKSGPWLDHTKVLLGFLLLGVAIELSTRILSESVAPILWGSLFLSVGAWLYRLNLDSRYQHYLRFIAISVLGIYGILSIVSGSLGYDSPINFLSHQTSVETSSPRFYRTVTSLNALQEVLTEKKNQAIIIDFYADWCISCKSIEHHILPKIDLKQTILIRADITRQTAEERALMAHYQVIAPPTFIFINRQGIQSYRLVGEFSVSEWQTAIKRIHENP